LRPQSFRLFGAGNVPNFQAATSLSRATVSQFFELLSAHGATVSQPFELLSAHGATVPQPFEPLSAHGATVPKPFEPLSTHGATVLQPFELLSAVTGKSLRCAEVTVCNRSLLHYNIIEIENMKIVRIRLDALRNEEWFQFMTEARDLIVKFTAQALFIVELFVLFLKLYADADVALEIIRKSPETEKMTEADHLRDQAFSGLHTTIRAAVHHFDPAQSEAARQLTIVFDRFGNLAHKAPNEETAGIYNLVQELRGAYAGFVTTLGLTAWVEELAARNEAYEALVKARNEEVAARPKLQVKQIRRELDGVYRQIVERIEALCLVQGPDSFTPFIDQLNAFVTRYNNVLAQRRGQRKTESESDSK
jgi:hypothetical protein